MFLVAQDSLVRFRRSDRPDPVIGEVVGTDHGLFVIRTDDGRTHHRSELHMTWVRPRQADHSPAVTSAAALSAA
jgi:hypothetical protein